MLKEPEIKLFGRKISLPENGTIAAGGEYSGESSNGSLDCDLSLEREVRERSESEEKQDQGDEDQATGELCETTAEDVDQNPEESQNPNASSESDNMSENQVKPENGEEKTLKKPDKILPCPRCSSMDTKFCYYNNYNVNQPRHFCKSCQRYWTAGGTMRNVPVGAGRRKNKNSGSHCHHITISEARTDSHNGFRNIKFSPNGTVLSFGPDSPLCESVASALKRVPNGVRNREDDCTTRDGRRKANGNGFPSPVPCIPGVPWPFPWNSAFPIPAICPPGYPLPYYTAPLWNCGVPNAWNIPWLPMPSPTPHQKGANHGPTSPLGKHSRNGELIHPNRTECKEPLESSSIVVPKTLRIDDPEEAAKSSIWSTLGIKCDAFRSEGLFKALQPKGDEKKAMVKPSPLLQANPAALSRSISFQERA